MRGQQGQATSEYIIMLAVVVSLFMLVIKTWIGPMYTRLSDKVAKRIETQFMGVDLHQYPMGRR